MYVSSFLTCLYWRTMRKHHPQYPGLRTEAWITAMAVANQLYHMARARKWEQCLSTLGTMRDRCLSCGFPRS